MMDSGPVRNMQSTLTNKFEKSCISLAISIRIYHDERSSECQIEASQRSPVASRKCMDEEEELCNATPF